MQNRLFSRRNDFKVQIRKSQINSIMANCRSKMQADYSKDLVNGRCRFLDNIFQSQLPLFTKIKLLIKSFIKHISNQSIATYDPQLNQIKNYQLFMCSFQTNIFITITDQSIPIEITGQQFCSSLEALSKEIISKILSLNESLLIIKKIDLTDKTYIPKIQSKMTECFGLLSQIKQVSEYCNYLLQKYTDLISKLKVTNLNYELMQTLTCCLIQLSCFRPTNYKNLRQLQIVTQFNQATSQLKVLLNKYIKDNIVNFLKYIPSDQLSIKIIINIIYFFGNIFVSISSNSQQQISQYTRLHQICFFYFKKALQIQTCPSNTEKRVVQSKQSSQCYAQLVSVIIWFIRNQILIVLGLYKMANQSINKHESSNQNKKPVNIDWISLIVNILQSLSRQFKKNNCISEQNSKTVCSIISIIKLLCYDFQLSLTTIWSLFGYLQVFMIKAGHKNHLFKLQQHFLQLTSDILDYKSKSQEESARILQQNRILQQKDQEIKKQFYRFVNQRASQAIMGHNISLGRLKLSHKILLSSKFQLRDIKSSLYQYICNNFDAFMTNSKTIVQYLEVKQYLSIIYEFFRLSQFQNSKSLMKSEILSYQKCSNILHLCEKIWQVDNKENDTIESLVLIKLMSGMEQFSIILKQVIIKEGYLQHFDSLSGQVNEDINRYVYEICEQLELNQ